MLYYTNDDVSRLCKKLYAYAGTFEDLDLLCNDYNGDFTFSISDGNVSHDILFINSYSRFIFFRNPRLLTMFLNAYEAAEAIAYVIEDLKEQNKLKSWIVVLSGSSEKSWIKSDYAQVKLLKALTELD